MRILINRRVVHCLFRSSPITMLKKVNFSSTPPGSDSSSSSEDIVEILNKIKNFIPNLTEDNHKGSCGRVGIIGGSSDYTGAPYFAGMAALRLGADLVHVFCCKDAAIPIKSYSPELMIHPILDTGNVVHAFEPWLPKLHALVIGPGLGKDSVVFNNVALIITYCQTKTKPCIPLIIDADALQLISERPNLIKNYEGPIILTPNAYEYSKMAAKLEISSFHEFAKYFNAVVVKKGANDIICNGVLMNMFKLSPEESVIVCDMPGSFRRCGGQGDILAGFIGTFVAWHEIHIKKQKVKFNFDLRIAQDNVSQWKNYFKGHAYAAYGGCLMTRSCSHLGFKEQGRSLTSSDMLTQINKVFLICFDK